MNSYETELLIIGGGAAGMSAAASALEKNIKTTLIECNSQVGGNGIFPRGIFAIDSIVQRNKLVYCSRDEIFRRCMEYSHWKIDGRIIRRLLNKSGDTISWLIEKGVHFTDVVHHVPNQFPEVYHITSKEEPAGRAIIKRLQEFCEGRGLVVMTSARGEKLLTNEAGEVCGAVCVDRQNKRIAIKAKKVIICTGGFSGNKEMIGKYYPDLDINRITEGGGIRHNGEGIKMAVEAGADIEGNFAMEMAAPKIKGHGPLNMILGKPYNIWINSFGKRFADESIVFNFSMAANACMRQPGGKVWVVFNQDILDHLLTRERNIIEDIHLPDNVKLNLLHSLEAAVEEGIAAKSENLKGIAEFIGCRPEVLKATVHDYVTSWTISNDAEFAKDERYIYDMSNGPYYAIEAGVDMLVTHGGIRVNEDFKALNSEYSPIENLFVAGVDFGGADAGVYNVEMSGHGFGFAVNSGRIAGETAAKEIMKEKQL
ncbi:MAG: FAD-binding protein [Emergencia sp.]